jgi:hypothetical protein
VERHQARAFLFGWTEIVLLLSRCWCSGPDTPLGQIVIRDINLIDAKGCGRQIYWGARCGGAEWERLGCRRIDGLRRFS